MSNDQSETDGPEDDANYREHPEKYIENYELDGSEKGVFKVEPYKSELLPHWSYADPESAEESANKLFEQYETYRENGDFVGMDMARKYCQMGFTRAMRYAKYPGGKKYDDDGEEREPERWADSEKREAAKIFKRRWDEIRHDERYQTLKEEYRNCTQ
ncbi:protein of unknown function [Haladaptatus litoreus]|uniref:DUF4385 domain-containing protein n=1 Tax=Haladaptatus litoreus TaxID=553468 RepID=A0A1N6UQK4_9EURY|nr:DUF4385 domain-containing protein [Haladaptatus litoreus]SIQ67904.1 protein of unknown function [Haladaptatus litoreus]